MQTPLLMFAFQIETFEVKYLFAIEIHVVRKSILNSSEVYYRIKLSTGSGWRISFGIMLNSSQVAEYKTQEILQLRSGSVRLINFASQNQSLTDSTS